MLTMNPKRQMVEVSWEASEATDRLAETPEGRNKKNAATRAILFVESLPPELKRLALSGLRWKEIAPLFRAAMLSEGAATGEPESVAQVLVKALSAPPARRKAEPDRKAAKVR